jgi:alpha-tubulin suppressor-like RCC1 family protein
VPPLFKAHVVDVACGGHHSLAVTARGEVLSWGRGSSGQLGHGAVTTCGCSLLEVTIVRVRRIAGDNSSVAIPKRVEALWKPEKFKEFAMKQKRLRKSSNEVADLGISVSCGWAHTAVTICRKLYLVGDTASLGIELLLC